MITDLENGALMLQWRNVLLADVKKQKGKNKEIAQRILDKHDEKIREHYRQMKFREEERKITRQAIDRLEAKMTENSKKMRGIKAVPKYRSNRNSSTSA